jgi:hypothetical protein
MRASKTAQLSDWKKKSIITAVRKVNGRIQEQETTGCGIFTLIELQLQMTHHIAPQQSLRTLLLKK